MKRKFSKIIILVLAFLLVGGLAVASAADTAGSNQNVLQQGMMRCRQQAQTALKAVSELTGLSTDEIRTQRAEGHSLLSIAEEKGVTEEALTSKVVAERTAALEQLKNDGKITEEQYQTCVTNMEARIKTNLERTTTGPMNGGQGMGKGGQGRGCGAGNGMQKGSGQNCPYATSASN